MLINLNTKIIGCNTYLIPYEEHHVPRYHMWMQSKELQELTASEPLTLEQEYEMQKLWRGDEDKCTFIIIHRQEYDETRKEIEAMIGDTNIFIKDKKEAIGEIEIMIAEKRARGQKLGWEAVIIMLLYGIEYIGVKIYEAKILMKNDVSIQMFKKLGFLEKSKSEVFQEISFEKQVDSIWVTWLKEQYNYEIQKYQRYC